MSMVRRKQPSLLKVITDEEVERIHRCSLRILGEIGVKFPNPEMLRRLADAGATVDFGAQTARIPEALVLKALACLPKEFTIAPADGGPPIVLGDGELRLSMDTSSHLIEVLRNRKRRGTADDVMRAIAVSNALDNVRLASAYCLPAEVRQDAADVYCYELLWTYSKKAVATWIYSARSADHIIEMAKIVAGGSEELRRSKILTYFAEPISPLQYAPHTLKIVLRMSEYELPVYLGPMVTSGGTGPVTLAGTLALHNAEILQGLVMSHVCNPRQPVIYSCHCHTLDLVRMNTQYGAPEQGLLAAAATQLARRYGLAICGNVMLTDSNTLDYMAGFQEAATAAYALAAGWDMLGFLGFGTIGVMGDGVGGHSLEKAIVQDEALSYLKRMLASFDVNDETLAFDAIRQAGIGGNFIAAEHTVAHMREEIWRGNGIFVNADYDAWATAGAESVTDRAARRLREILDRSLPLPPALPDDKVRALREITAAAMKAPAHE
jgi:trimethylamine--corrinoid protein Co-methyltransferase